jgi:hypothetical protein
MFDFVVEDGTGLTNATSYVTVLEADDYAEFVKNEDWLAFDDEDKEYSLIIAAQFLDNLLTWQSSLLNVEQSLNFPRVEFKDKNGRTVSGVPNVIKTAQIQLAIASNEEELSYNISRLKSQSWGNASETYAGDFIEENTVYNIRSLLSSLGYGRTSNMVELVRA